MEVLNSYKYACKAGSITCLTLFISWMFLPNILFNIFAIEYNNYTIFLGQRIAALFFGLSIILFFLANENNARVQKILSVSFAISCLILAYSGVTGLQNGAAGIGILIAIIVELFFAFWFFYSTWKISFSILINETNE
ncbi:MAG: hypothetical protein J0L55_17560 [Caulobacterales bacterium]|nr:hypothetical protein [Caulobacterales bacterium]MCA0371318.1 hypothetical protein [Pseudomonadota bacterium]